MSRRSESIRYKMVGDHIRGFVEYNANAGVSEEMYYLPMLMQFAPTIITTGMTKIIEIYEADNSRMEQRQQGARSEPTPDADM